jgi:hypothetical protein
MLVEDLTAASRREAGLYGDLVSSYRTLRTALAGEGFDVALIDAERARASAVTDELRTVAARLAPHRLTGTPVAEEVRAAWQESAELAATAAELNAEVGSLARARQLAIGEQLAQAARGRRALGAYRPDVPTAPGIRA